MDRSIPACAGEPSYRWSSQNLIAVGSIPACAGEPHWKTLSAAVYAVYPRVCGGTTGRGQGTPPMVGLSPRVRGNLNTVRPRQNRLGSIPACAGEPKTNIIPASVNKVYPRVCGGTVYHNEFSNWCHGLSPRVRGNLAFYLGPAPAIRSIPACAGEPHLCQCRADYRKVYPRVCGGTCRSRPDRRYASGLSPRVRGNQGTVDPRIVGSGSIPACAGEPKASCLPSGGVWVYPRVCGGTYVRFHQFR